MPPHFGIITKLLPQNTRLRFQNPTLGGRFCFWCLPGPSVETQPLSALRASAEPSEARHGVCVSRCLHWFPLPPVESVLAGVAGLVRSFECWRLEKAQP